MSILYVGLLAKNAVEAGLSVKPYIKTSMSPGSGVVTYYLKESGAVPFLEKLGYVKRKLPLRVLLTEVFKSLPLFGFTNMNVRELD